IFCFLNMNIDEDFNKSFDLFKHHKKIIIPTILSIIIPLILFTAFFQFSSFGRTLKDLINVSQEIQLRKENYYEQRNYEIYKKLEELREYEENLSKLEGPERDKRYLEYLDYSSKIYKEIYGSEEDFKRNLSEDEKYRELRMKADWYLDYKNWLTPKNILLIIIFSLLSLFSHIYFTCMSYAIITLTIKNENISFKNLLKFTNKFFLELIFLEVIILFIIIVPIAILFLIFLYMLVNPWIGLLLIPFIFILALIYVTIMSARLLYTIPIMYLEKETPLKSISHSFKITKHHLGQVFVILVILFLFSLVNNYFTNQEKQLHQTILFGNTLFVKIISLIFLIVFVLLESFVTTFRTTFLFYNYFDFKKILETDRDFQLEKIKKS
ncbi:MAG: hypothetical protein QXU20_03415, partial [Candidatus Woesearchaeota archaeon]